MQTNVHVRRPLWKHKSIPLALIFTAFIPGYLREFHKLTMAAVKAQKVISIPEGDDDPVLENPIDNLSLKLPDLLPTVMHADLIEKKALRILNTPGAIVLHPTFHSQEEESKQYLVARNSGHFYNVTFKLNTKVSCDCKGFR